MQSRKKLFRFLAWPGVILLQLIMTQVVTFLVSFFFPGMGDSAPRLPSYVVIVFGITFAAGIFLVGWLAIRLHWLDLRPKYPARFVGALIGSYLPMIVALIVFRSIEAGSPFFLVSIIVGILGFYIPGWIVK